LVRGVWAAWSLGDVQVIRVQDFADLILDPLPCLPKTGERANDARWLTIVSDHNLEIASSVWFDGVCAHGSIIGQSSTPSIGTYPHDVCGIHFSGFGLVIVVDFTFR